MGKKMDYGLFGMRSDRKKKKEILKEERRKDFGLKG